MKGYTYASGASVSVALGIRKALQSQTRHMKGAKLVVFNSISAFAACSTAGILNAYFMRQTEVEKGIDLVNPNKPSQVIGKSKAAGWKAVLETSISRCILTIPILLPSAGLYFIEKRRLMPKSFVG